MTLLFWALALSIPLGVLLFEIWEGSIKPRLIKPEEIERCCDELLAQYGPRAYELARINEDRAWRHSNSFEQGKWRRVAERLATSSVGNALRHGA